MKDERHALAFKRWLVNTKGLKDKSARDVISRCRRVERTLDIDLAEFLSSGNKINEITSLIERKSSDFFSKETKLVYAQGVLFRAVRLYGEFKQT